MKKQPSHLSREEWHLLILRVYIGLDFIHHFAEKFGLLGFQAYHNVYLYFSGLHFSNAASMVTIAGLCELGAFIGFTFGLFTRIAAVGTACYLLIAAIMGNHFAFGFTWANTGGGWEFPVMWTVLCLLYVITGGGKVSADAWLRQKLSPSLQFLVR